MSNARLKIFLVRGAFRADFPILCGLFGTVTLRRLGFWGWPISPLTFFFLLSELGELGVGESLVSNDGLLAAVAGLIFPS